MGSQRGFTLIELLIVVTIIGIIAAIAVSQLLRARSAANEAAAISSVRAVVNSQMSYSNSCGYGGYAAALPTLGVPTSPGGPPFLSADLTSAAVISKSSYRHTLAPGAGSTPGPADCNGTATESAFYTSAEPLAYGTSGNRAFASSAAGTIWAVSAAASPTEPFGAPAAPIR